MRLTKPIFDYTVAGLLFIASQTKDDNTRSLILAELRRRRELAGIRANMIGHNRAEKNRLNTELEIEGLKSTDEQIRRNANRDLFAEMKDRAFDTVDIPTGLTPVETVRQYNRDIHDAAKRLYNEYKQSVKKEVVKARRETVVKVRKDYYVKLASQKKLRKIESDAYRNARFPLIGRSVYYTDTTHELQQKGTVRGVTFNKNVCAFIVRIQTPTGERIGRALSAIEPVNDLDKFNDIRILYKGYENGERIKRERDMLVNKVEVYNARIAELDRLIADYSASNFYAMWQDVEKRARSSAWDARRESSNELF